jgi:hypothetical protein
VKATPLTPASAQKCVDCCDGDGVGEASGAPSPDENACENLLY